MRKQPKSLSEKSLSQRLSKAEYREVALRQIEAQEAGMSLDADQALADMRREATETRKKPDWCSEKLHAEYQEVKRRQIEAQKAGVRLDFDQALADVRREATEVRNREAKEEAKRKAEYEKWRVKKEPTRARPGLNSKLLCPHCGERGSVATEVFRAKRGVSGAKLTGAFLTLGVSILGTGLSRKETLTQAYCHNCGSRWVF